MPTATKRFTLPVLLGVALLATAPVAQAQQAQAQQHATTVDTPATGHLGHDHEGGMCVLPAMPFEGALSIPAPERAFAVQARQAAATFNVDYVSGGSSLYGYACSSWPSAAQTAFQYAADVWGGLLNSPQTITVKACWSTSLPSSTLGAAAARSAHGNFTNVPYTNTFYPAALANALADSDLNGSANEEIYAIFNGNRTDWYYGTDASPAFTEYDFVTVVMHEIGHGLGFAGSAGISDGTGTGRCRSYASGQGCINNGSLPYAFDRFAYDGGGTSVLTTSKYANPSSDLATILTGGTVGGSTGIFFTGSAVGTQQLNTPGSYASGSTYSHFDLGLYPSELMKPSLPNGQAIHDPGLALDLLEDTGWASVVPVELTAFDVRRAGEDVLLSWATASETNNSGFEVQMRSPAAADFAVLDFVQGHGTTAESQTYTFRAPDLTPGTYAFRLRQVDFDGAFEVFPEVEVTVEVVGTHWAATAYPNPFVDEATVTFAVREREPVRVVVYDLLGRAVQTVYTGTPAANTPVRVRLDGQRLASGAYVVEIAGERFRETQRVTVVS
ncbi:MAG: T9SS type A sorting domain-containing protein [Bacteroidota bacterium]